MIYLHNSYTLGSGYDSGLMVAGSKAEMAKQRKEFEQTVREYMAEDKADGEFERCNRTEEDYKVIHKQKKVMKTPRTKAEIIYFAYIVAIHAGG